MPQQIVSNPKNETIEPKKLIVFNDVETIEQLTNVLENYFPNRKSNLVDALNGQKLLKPLTFPNNQNKFVELFRRVKYNSKILSSNADINEWICTNFEYTNKRKENTAFKKESVRDILNKGRMIAFRNKIATNVFPFISHDTLMQEKNNKN